MFVFGGYNNTLGLTNDFYCLDLTNNTWKEIKQEKGASLPPPRHTHFASSFGSMQYETLSSCLLITFVEGKMVVFGGIGQDSAIFSDLWVYDFSSGIWTEIEAGEDAGGDGTESERGGSKGKPTGRFGFGAFVYRSELCLFGGYDKKKVWNDAWTLDLSSSKPKV